MQNLTVSRGWGIKKIGADVTREGGHLGLSAEKEEVSPDACAVWIDKNIKGTDKEVLSVNNLKEARTSTIKFGKFLFVTMQKWSFFTSVSLCVFMRVLLW